MHKVVSLISVPNLLRTLAIWFLIHLLLGAAPARLWTAIPTSVNFEHIGVTQGLSQNTIYATLQDRRGFLWFATEDGLNRYDGIRFRTYRTPQGLISNWITTLFEDRDGTLWVGTMKGGLHRLDRNLDHFKAVPVVSGALDVTTLAEDATGNLWMGTWGKGLFLIPRDQLNREAPAVRSFLPDGKPGSLPGGNVRTLYRGQDGQFWVGLLDGGLCRLEGGTSPRFTHYAADPAHSDTSAPSSVNALAEDQQGGLWIGTNDGLYRLRPGRGFQRFLAGSEPDSLAGNLIRVLHRDRIGELWIGSDGGGLHKLLPFRPQDKGPRFLRIQHNAWAPHSLSENAVESIYEDRSGVLWVGTYVAGLNRLALNRARPEARERPPIMRLPSSPAWKHGLSGNSITAVRVDRRGRLLVGTNGAGLDVARLPVRSDDLLKFDVYRAQPGRPGALQDDVITCLYEDSRQQLWAGTFNGGLARVDRPESGPFRFTHYKTNPLRQDSLGSNFVESILEDRKGGLWVGGVDGGLNRFDAATGRFRRYRTLPPGMSGTDSVYAMVEDSYGTLWLGTFDGLVRFDPESGALQHFLASGAPNALSHPNVFALHLEPSGDLWIGTSGGGLNRLRVGPWSEAVPPIDHFGLEQGLPTNVVRAIQPDGRGGLFLSTSLALCAFDPVQGRARALSWQEGIDGNEYLRNSAFRDPAGEIFFGGTRGLFVFHPEDLIADSTPPPMVFTDLQLYNRSVPIGEPVDGRVILSRSLTESGEIVLSHREVAVSFLVAALHYTAPDQFRYAFRMEGIDDRWNFTGNRAFITYTTLPPGQYALRVKASNADGLWNEAGLTLNIRVLPPWWRAWWFQFTALAAVTAFILFAVRWRFRRLKRINAVLEERVQVRTEALALANTRLTEADRLKERMTAMLVHDLRSPLSGIQLTLHLIEEEGEPDPTLLSRCHHGIRDMIQMLNDLLDVFRYQEGGVPLTLAPMGLREAVAGVLQTFEAIALKQDVRLELQLPEDLPLIQGDDAKVGRILSNLLGNALKFTPAGGAISLAATHEQPWVRLDIRDTGRGIPPEALPHIFDPYRQVTAKDSDLGSGLGLAIVNRLMDAHGGRVQVQSEVGQGTTFSLYFKAVDLA